MWLCSDEVLLLKGLFGYNKYKSKPLKYVRHSINLASGPEKLNELTGISCRDMLWTAGVQRLAPAHVMPVIGEMLNRMMGGSLLDLWSAQ